MRAVVQRTETASVSVDGQVVGAAPRPGLCVLVGVTHSDQLAQAQALASKVINLRILREERSALDTGAAILAISQFTLYGDTRKGRRPSWVAAAPGEQAEPLFNAFVEQLRVLGEPAGVQVATGVFGAKMRVELVNDGPFTVLLEV